MCLSIKALRPQNSESIKVPSQYSIEFGLYPTDTVRRQAHIKPSDNSTRRLTQSADPPGPLDGCISVITVH